MNAGWRIPFTRKAVIDERHCLDLIDRMRIAIPQEIAQAKRVLQDREEILAQARLEAERIVDQGHEQANFIIQEKGLLKAVEEKSQAIMEEARARARETQAGADDYALDALTMLEGELDKIMAQVQHGIDLLSKDKGARSRPAETPPAPR
ncbi:MAG: ATPase [Chloroflexi bacterium]|nr:ATPase [Chloroflexota bacterium]